MNEALAMRNPKDVRTNQGKDGMLNLIKRKPNSQDIQIGDRNFYVDND
jgi:hypothetical protein